MIPRASRTGVASNRSSCIFISLPVQSGTPIVILCTSSFCPSCSFFVRENVPLQLGLSFPSLRAPFLNDDLERTRLNAAHYAPGQVRWGTALVPFLLNSNLKLHSLGMAFPSTVGG